MRIFYSQKSEPMLLGAAAELNVLHQKMREFLASNDQSASFHAQVDFSPAPYEDFLNGFRIQKTDGLIMLSLSKDRWLELSGSQSNLEKYIDHFQFEESEQNGHHHPDNADYMASGSLGLIVESNPAGSEHNAA